MLLYIFLHFSKVQQYNYHVSFKNGMTEKINIEQSVIAYVIDARLPLKVPDCPAVLGVHSTANAH